MSHLDFPVPEKWMWSVLCEAQCPAPRTLSLTNRWLNISTFSISSHNSVLKQKHWVVTNDPCFIPTWIHQVLYSFQCIFAQCHPLCPQNSEVAYAGLFYVFSFPGSSVQVNSGMWVIFTFYLPFSDRLGWVVGKMAHFQVRKSALMKAWLSQWVTEVAVFSFWAQIWSYSHCSKNTLPVKKKKGGGHAAHRGTDVCTAITVGFCWDDEIDIANSCAHSRLPLVSGSISAKSGSRWGQGGGLVGDILSQLLMYSATLWERQLLGGFCVGIYNEL